MLTPSAAVYSLSKYLYQATQYIAHMIRYAFIRNMQCGSGITITVYTYNKTNAVDLVNSVCSLAQPVVKYAIKTAELFTSALTNLFL